MGRLPEGIRVAAADRLDHVGEELVHLLRGAADEAGRLGRGGEIDAGKGRVGAEAVEEGVAFYGRTGNALMKSLKRLQIDPLAVYGTLCVKCPVPDPALADPACIARLLRELAIVQPKIVVVMGEEALAVLNELCVPLARRLAPVPGEIQTFTPSIEALYVPSIDEALDDEAAKREFWAAFRTLGRWWSDLPPY